nr:hypothetical protein [Pandoravirus massiliensis]
MFFVFFIPRRKGSFVERATGNGVAFCSKKCQLFAVSRKKTQTRRYARRLFLRGRKGRALQSFCCTPDRGRQKTLTQRTRRRWCSLFFRRQKNFKSLWALLFACRRSTHIAASACVVPLTKKSHKGTPFLCILARMSQGRNTLKNWQEHTRNDNNILVPASTVH